MENKERVERANEIAAIIETTKPVVEWEMSVNVWISPDLAHVRVYLNNKKRKPVAILAINADGKIIPQWLPGSSLTRQAIKPALGL